MPVFLASVGIGLLLSALVGIFEFFLYFVGTPWRLIAAGLSGVVPAGYEALITRVLRYLAFIAIAWLFLTVSDRGRELRPNARDCRRYGAGLSLVLLYVVLRTVGWLTLGYMSASRLAGLLAITLGAAGYVYLFVATRSMMDGLSDVDYHDDE